MYASEKEHSDRKMILNSNQGVTNIIESDVIHKDMAAVTDKLFSILKSHYGPYSKFAGVDPNQPLEDTIFTKDGANIVKSIEFASTLEDIVRKAVFYIGTNVEKSSGDGTTSSMMFMCSMLKHMNASLHEVLPVSYHTLYGAFNDFLEMVKLRMEPYKINAKNPDGTYATETVRKIVYSQTYTSSHGNKELAKAVADMFAACPPEMWPKMTFGRRHYESDKLFEIKTTGGQYQLDDCSTMSKTVFNREAGRYLEYEKCKLIVINGKVDVNGPHWINTVQPILDECDDDHPVVILARPGADDYSYGKLMEFITKKNEKTQKRRALCVVWYTPTHERLNDFVNIQCVAGFNPREFAEGEFSGIPCVIENAYCKYEFDSLIIDHLYEDKDADPKKVNERPQFKHSDTPYFREWCETIEKYIGAYEAAELVNPRQQKELRDFRNVYNRLRYDKQIYLLIGGKTFDNLSMYDVVEDVIKAAIHTLEEGAVVSNSKTLYAAANEIKQISLAHFDTLTRQQFLIYWFAKNVVSALDEFSDVVLDMLYPKGIKPIQDHPRNGLLYRIGCLLAYSSSKRNNGLYEESFDTGYSLDLEDRFTQEERNDFRIWWFNNSVDLLTYDPRKSWEDQTPGTTVVPLNDVRYNTLKPDSVLVIQPSNADIVMLERFAEIAIKFILTERFIVMNAAYLNKEKKGKK